MARQPTALSSVRIALEGGLATPKASPAWLYPWVTDVDIVPDSTPIELRYLTADRFIRPPAMGEHSAAGRLSCIVGPENLHKLLWMMFPNRLAYGISSTGAVIHYMDASTNTIYTMEMQQDNGYVETWNRGGFIRSAEFSSDRNSVLNCNLDLQFQRQEIVTAGTYPASPTLSTLDPFTDLKGTISRAGAAVTDMDGFSLRLDFNPLDFKTFGNRWISDVLPGKQEVTWELACAFTSDTEFRRFLGDSTDTSGQAMADAYQTVRIEWQFQTGQNAATGYPYTLKFLAYGGIYKTFPQGIPSDNEILRSRPVALIRYNATGGADLAVEILNTLGSSGYYL